MTKSIAFGARHVGTVGCEILDRDGNIVAWVVDEPWAALIASMLNGVDREGLHSVYQPGKDGATEPELTHKKCSGSLKRLHTKNKKSTTIWTRRTSDGDMGSTNGT